MIHATYQPSHAFHEIEDCEVMNREIITTGYFQTDFSSSYLETTSDAFAPTIAGWSEGYILRITDDTFVGVDPPRFMTTVCTPHIAITWRAAPHERFDATVTRNGETLFSPVLPAGPDRRIEDVLTVEDQMSPSVYKIRDATDPGRVLSIDSELVFHDGEPTHLVPRTAVDRAPSGAYIAVATFADRTVTGRFTLLD